MPMSTNASNITMKSVVVISTLIIGFFFYIGMNHPSREQPSITFEPWPRGPIRWSTAPSSLKIDAVYTWVNGSDPEFIKQLDQWSKKERQSSSSSSLADGGQPQSPEKKRFNDNEELKYSLRSLERYANWINNVYIVTNGQVPSWLNLDNPRVRVVTHSEIYPDLAHLPTFSSPSIETHLHRIPGVSEYFLYLNDDVFFGAPTTPQDFLLDDDVQRVYLSWEIPDCAPSCSESFIGDKYCDVPCNVSQCNFDGGDCLERGEGRKVKKSKTEKVGVIARGWMMERKTLLTFFGGTRAQVGDFGDWGDEEWWSSSSSGAAKAKKAKEETHCAKGCDVYWWVTAEAYWCFLKH